MMEVIDAVIAGASAPAEAVRKRRDCRTRIGGHSRETRPPRTLVAAGSAEDERSRPATLGQPFEGAFDAYGAGRVHEA
jgi:hypothetical protein